MKKVKQVKLRVLDVLHYFYGIRTVYFTLKHIKIVCFNCFPKNWHFLAQLWFSIFSTRFDYSGLVFKNVKENTDLRPIIVSNSIFPKLLHVFTRNSLRDYPSLYWLLKLVNTVCLRAEYGTVFWYVQQCFPCNSMFRHA